MRTDLGKVTGLVEALTTAIGAGEFRPGEPLIERRLAQRFGTSRTPVREALRYLEHQGMVFSVPGKGTFVAPVSTQDIEEVFVLRELLETMAARLAAPRIPREDLVFLKDRLESLSTGSPSQEYFDADRRLHELFSRYCGNRRLGELLSYLSTQIIRVRHTSALLPRRFEASRQEHLAIVNALLGQDIDEVEARLRHHLRNVRESALEVCRTGLLG